jgi:hypothetical protein
LDSGARSSLVASPCIAWSSLARISETIRRFEVKHPAVTAYLGEIAAALG